jgi:hypothetical protein
MKTATLILTFGFFTVTLAADDKAPSPKRETVKAIIDVKFVYQEKKPPVLQVTARGMVPTGGWKDIRLDLAKTKTPPANGVYELNLTAVPPDGPATQALEEVKATYEWKDPPLDLKGLKVNGVGEGAKTVMFQEKK